MTPCDNTEPHPMHTWMKPETLKNGVQIEWMYICEGIESEHRRETDLPEHG